jgi:hypothetical protein
MVLYNAEFSIKIMKLSTPPEIAKVVALTSFSALSLFAIAPAQASVLFVNSRAGLGANDSVDWAQLGPDRTVLSNPFTATSSGGLGVTGQFTGGSGELRTQSASWAGNFAIGDAVLYAWDGNGGIGPLTLTFANAVSGVGAQIMADYYGRFTGSIEAFDSFNNSLGLFSNLSGVSNGDADNSAVFWGISSTNSDIKSIVFNASDDFGDGPNDFTINQLSLVTANTTAVPEPFTIVGTLIGGTAALRMRKKLKSTSKV